MALSITSKVLIGVTSTATLGGLGYGAYSQFWKTSDVKEALNKKSKTILDLNATSSSKDYEHFEELVKQHKSGKPKGKTKIADLNLGTGDGIQALKDKCKVLLETKEGHQDFEKNLKDAKDWCTNESAPRKVSKLLDKRNKVLLKDATDENWTEQWKSFKAKYEREEPKGNWEIKTWNTSKSSTTVPAELKAKCTENGEMSLMLNTEDDFLGEIEKYCAKEKPQ